MQPNSKIYRGTTMQRALSQVRRELGGNALILGTREVRPRGLFGLGRRALFEVIVADSRRQSSRTALDALVWNGSSLPELNENLRRLHANVEGLSRQGHINQWTLDIPDFLTDAYAQLLAANVPEPLAERIVLEVADQIEMRTHPTMTQDVIDRLVQRHVESKILIAPSLEMSMKTGATRIVAFVGPKGVGKTTTVAKLAARCKIKGRLAVGLVSIDAHRIGAVDQLRTYADIFDVPLIIAQEPVDLRRAIDSLGAMDLVLIDTAGRGPRDEVKVHELGAFLNEARADEVHLVLNSSFDEQTLRAMITRFVPTRPNRLILTKLDEPDGLGVLLTVLGSTERPISYLTTGQAVPHDIEHAEQARLARLILGREAVVS